MAEETEYRLSTLETVLAEFIMQTNRSLNRMERDTADFKQQMQRDHEEQQRKEAQRLAEAKLYQEEQQRKEEQRLADKQRADEEWKAEKKQMNREWNQKWGEMAEKLGSFAEDLAAPNLKRIAREQFGGKPIDYYSVRIDKRNPVDPSQTFEFDAILVTDKMVFLLESKFTVRMKYLEGLPRLIENFKLSFPEYEAYELIPVFASMSIPPDQVKYLTSLGIYAMALGEETMELLNFNELRGRSA